MVHCGSIRQTASILSMSKECLRTGDKAHVLFRFIKHPEYIRPQQRMVFREGRTKAVGNVLKPLPITSIPQQNRTKTNKMQSQRGSQNQNPNIQHNQHQASTTSSVGNEDAAADGVLEKTIDKRDFGGSGGGGRGGRRKRGGGASNNTVIPATAVVQP